MRHVALILLLAACNDTTPTVDGTLSSPPTDPPLDTASTGDDDDTTTTQSNEPPIADAGDDQSVMVTDEVQLDASGSYDPNDDTLSFDWAFVQSPAGSQAQLLNASRSNASFYALRDGTYTLSVVVDDGEFSDLDEVNILVTAPNDGPVANAGPDQAVDVGDVVVLNGGASYDPDDDPLAFAWRLTAPAGSLASLNDPSAPMPSFQADLDGVYTADLIVSDGQEDSLPDQVQVIAQAADDSDCLSCAQANIELERRFRAGDLAAGTGLVLLPIWVLLAQRRRED